MSFYVIVVAAEIKVFDSALMLYACFNPATLPLLLI